jgi:threonine/homoserine/homoserine lactone efflux protein
MLDRLLNHPGVFGIISIAGSIFLLHLGLGSLRARALSVEEIEVGTRSLRKGIAANLLNPNPYIFWISVGTPAIISAMSVSATHAAAFVIPFFVFIVGSKVLLSRIVHGSRSFLSSKAYLWILRVLGVLLMLYAVSVLREGLAHLGIGLPLIS